jgi:hypothetical protein
MSARNRRPNGHRPEQDPAVEEAIVEPDIQLVPIPISEQPLRMAPNGKLRLDTPTDPTQPMVLVLDANEGIWKAVLLPSGAKWVLQAETAAKPAIWTPQSPK